MERFIAGLVGAFEAGKMDRREFCQTVALAATVYGAGEAANAQATRGFKVLAVNHLDYACPDYARARDFFINVFGLENAAGTDDGRKANLTFGPEPGKGGSYLRVRNPAPGDRAPGQQPGQVWIDHICFTLSNWEEGRVRAAMKAKGPDISGGRPGSLHVLDPFNYDIQFASIAEENAFKR
jgi:catechol 2,3-dioxygenase-like lactoylglutathione lyase family enzyme